MSYSPAPTPFRVTKQLYDGVYHWYIEYDNGVKYETDAADIAKQTANLGLRERIKRETEHGYKIVSIYGKLTYPYEE